MLRRVMLLLVLMGSIVGCSRSPEQWTRYHNDGRKKPVVAVLPMTDSSVGTSELPWEVSQELTEGLKSYLLANSNLYVEHDQTVYNKSQGLKSDPIDDQQMSFARQFRGSEYVVMSELVDYKEVTYVRGEIKPIYMSQGNPGTVLCIKVRIKVVDVKDPAHPKIVLQELIHSNHMIPYGLDMASVDYATKGAGQSGYLATPIGTAHARLKKDMAERVSEYVLLSNQYR
jgi:hypothetical protein